MNLINGICPPLDKYIDQVHPLISKSVILEFLQKKVFASIKELPTVEDDKYSKLYQFITKKDPWLTRFNGNTYQSGNKEFNYFYTSYTDATRPTLCFRGENLNSANMSTEGFVIPSRDLKEDPITYKKISSMPANPPSQSKVFFKTDITCDDKLHCKGSNDFGDTYESHQDHNGNLVQKVCLKDSSTSNPICSESEGRDFKPLEVFLNRGHVTGKSWFQYGVVMFSAVACVTSLYKTCQSVSKSWNVHQTKDTQCVKREMMKAASFFMSALASGAIGYFCYRM